MQAREKYISPTADIVQYPHFEAGVVKIQNGIENQMNESEKAAVRVLKKPISSSGTIGLGGTFRLAISVNEWIRGGNGMKKRATTLIATSFWAPLTSWRECLALPSMFCLRTGLPNFLKLSFLKINSRFWDAALVEEAIGEARKERASARYMAHKVRDDDTDKEG